MLDPDMIRGKVGISPYHLQRRMPQYLLQGEDISTIGQELGSKGVPAQMSMQSLDTTSDYPRT